MRKKVEYSKFSLNLCCKANTAILDPNWQLHPRLLPPSKRLVRLVVAVVAADELVVAPAAAAAVADELAAVVAPAPVVAAAAPARPQQSSPVENQKPPHELETETETESVDGGAEEEELQALCLTPLIPLLSPNTQYSDQVYLSTSRIPPSLSTVPFPLWNHSI